VSDTDIPYLLPIKGILLWVFTLILLFSKNSFSLMTVFIWLSLLAQTYDGTFSKSQLILLSFIMSLTILMASS